MSLKSASEGTEGARLAVVILFPVVYPSAYDLQKKGELEAKDCEKYNQCFHFFSAFDFDVDKTMRGGLRYKD